jgi:hypothetical protein
MTISIPTLEASLATAQPPGPHRRGIERRAAWRPVREGSIARLIKRWRLRARQRRDLSLLVASDFGDLPVSSILFTEELRKWPWQEFGPQWGEIRSAPDPCRADGVPSPPRHVGGEP